MSAGDGEQEDYREREERRRLLAEAFPVDPFRGALCALCRAPRRPHHALCSWCWSNLPPGVRRRLLRLDVYERARALLALRSRG